MGADLRMSGRSDGNAWLEWEIFWKKSFSATPAYRHTPFIVSKYNFYKYLQGFGIGPNSVSDFHILEGAELKKSVIHRDILITFF